MIIRKFSLCNLVSTLSPMISKFKSFGPNDRLNRLALHATTDVTAALPSSSSKTLEPVRNVDVLICGGGVAGLTSLLACSNSKVLLIDSENALGGTSRLLSASYAGECDKKTVDNLVERVNKYVISHSKTVEIKLESTAMAAFSDGFIGVQFCGGRYGLVKPKRIVIATGSRPGYSVFDGNFRTGVFFPDRLLAMPMKFLSNKRIAVVGGDSQRSVNASSVYALELAKRGAKIVCVGFEGIDIGNPHSDALRKLNVEMLYSHAPLAAKGERKIEAMTFRDCETGRMKEVKCDIVLSAIEPVPALEIAVKAKEWGIPYSVIGAASETVRKEGSCEKKKFDVMADIEDSAIICRCEKVTLGAVKKAAAASNGDLNYIKQATRQGMGYCGGFQCTAAVTKLILGSEVFNDVNPRIQRPTNLEVSFGALSAAEIPTNTSKSGVPKLSYESDRDENTFDFIVLGAGAVGTPTALFLKQHFGTLKSVLVLDASYSVGQGDNKRALGGVRATFGNPGKIVVGLESVEIFRNWTKTTGDEIDWKDNSGYLFPVYTEKDEKNLTSLFPVQHKYGLKISFVDKDKVKKLAPGIEENGLRVLFAMSYD